jgi:RNase P subunit RPR2
MSFFINKKTDHSRCKHCNIPFSVGTNIYIDEDGNTDKECYYFCDECGADYS